MMVRNKTLIALLVISGILLAITVGISYAYFSAIINADETEEAYLTAGALRLDIEDTNVITLSEIVPGDVINKTFTITNTGDAEVAYDVYLSDILNTFTTKTDLVYEIISEDAYNTDGEITLPDAPEKIIDAYSIDVNETHHYTLKMTYKEINRDQRDNVGKEFFGKIKINEYQDYQTSKLVSGSDFNKAIKRLSGMENPNEWDTNLLIKNIVRTNTPPAENVTKETVSIENQSDNPVYVWFEDEIIYIYSKSEKIYANANASRMFEELDGISTLDVSWLDTKESTKMEYMFASCSNAETINLGNHFDTSNVTTMIAMFKNLKNLTSINFGHKFDTSKVSFMRELFRGMKSIATLDLPDEFNTKSATNMTNMFNSVESITVLNLTKGFDTSKCTDFSGTFSNMTAIQSINLGPSFSLASNPTVYNMFAYDSNLTKIYAPVTLDFSTLTSNTSGAFTRAPLVGGAGTAIEVSDYDIEYARVDCGTTKKGYFTNISSDSDYNNYCAS